MSAFLAFVPGWWRPRVLRLLDRWRFFVRTKLNLDFRLLYRSVVLALIAVGWILSLAYLTHVLLSALFGSLTTFFSVFGIIVGLAILVIYDADAFKWGNNPQVDIRRLREGESEE